MTVSSGYRRNLRLRDAHQNVQDHTYPVQVSGGAQNQVQPISSAHDLPPLLMFLLSFAAEQASPQGSGVKITTVLAWL